jgi:hypothetical protein
MAEEFERQTLRDYGNRKKRYQKIRSYIISILLLAIVLIGIIYWFWLSNMKYHSYKVTNTSAVTGENELEYISYKDAVVKYSKDGAEAIDKTGKTIWKGSYEMKDPIADTCGNYVVIADRGNKIFYIYNEKGEVGSITTLYDIDKVEIAKQGVVAALMENEDTNYVKLYYLDGSVVSKSEDANMLSEMVKDVSEVGYPLDIALSEDGKKLIVSFLSVNSGKLLSNIGFYNFGEVGKNYTNNFMGGYNYEGIIPSITFLNNDEACVFKENGFILYNMPETPNVDHEETFDRKIKSVFYSDKYVGVVLAGEEGASKELMLYNLKGKKVLDKKIDFDYNKIILSGEDIIMYDNLSCRIIKTNGKEKFQYTFSSNLSAFYPINNLDRYFLINGSEISEIMLK